MAKKNSSPDGRLLESVGVQACDVLEDEVFAVEGTPTVTVKLENGQYRNKPLVGGQEFFLADSYLGARGQLLLVFEPADGREYKHIELEVKKLDSVFPMFGGVLGEKFGIGEEEAEKVFKELVQLAALRARDDVKQKEKKAAEEKAAEEKRKAFSYQDNPDFGRF